MSHAGGRISMRSGASCTTGARRGLSVLLVLSALLAGQAVLAPGASATDIHAWGESKNCNKRGIHRVRGQIQQWYPELLQKIVVKYEFCYKTYGSWIRRDKVIYATAHAEVHGVPNTIDLDVSGGMWRGEYSSDPTYDFQSELQVIGLPFTAIKEGAQFRITSNWFGQRSIALCAGPCKYKGW